MANRIQFSDKPARLMLEGVPRVGFWPFVQGKPGAPERPEDVPWPSCLHACMEYLGESYSYTYLMGTTGAAFFLNWKPGWHLDNAAAYYMSSDASASYVRGFESVGYAYEIICGKDFSEHEAEMRQRIIESIQKGRPCMSHGIIGPPETVVITGYDESGDVIIGWSFFQGELCDDPNVEYEPSGYFRKRDWFKDTWDLILIGDKQAEPKPGEVLRTALEWALRVVRTPVTWGERHNGLAAYETWAQHILRDEEITADAKLPDSPFEVHSDAVGVVAEGRWYASRFLAEMAKYEPKMSSELLAAASCYAAEHDLMWKIWEIMGGNERGEAQRRMFLESDARRQMAAIIRESRAKDSEAIEHIEKALQIA